MTLIELGGLAGALVAIVTLFSKLVALIAAIQKLISRIEQMAVDLVEYEGANQVLARDVCSQGVQLGVMEELFVEVRRELAEMKESLKEMLKHVF